MKKILAIIALTLTLASCNKFLDMTPTDRVSSKTMWENTTQAEYSINYLYTYIWDFNASPTWLGLTESLTDELKYTSYNYNAMAYIPSEMAYGGQILTAGYVDVYMGWWTAMYTAIRRVNEGLSFLKDYGKMSDSDKARLTGELKFLRGYFYFELVKRYKDVILYDENLSAITKDKAISTEEAGWNFIQTDLNFASQNLPAASAANGRINKGMAYGLLTRAMLYAKRYQAVVDAAVEVEKLGYALEPKYADAFGKSLAAGNKEAILQYTFDYASGITHNFNSTYTPGGDYTLIGSKGGALGVPTQEIVESYELATGGFPDWTPWHAAAGTTTNPPYDKLEPRFAATILYNGAAWKGRVIEPYIDGTDGWAAWKTVKEPKGKTVTGYFLKKNIDESYDVNTSAGSNPFTFMRYAEILLNKAEACYQLGGMEADANAAVRDIRTRVGLPYTDKSGGELWDAICQERKVELAFEGLRYWDLRRWEIASSNYPKGLANYQQHGLKIEKDGDKFLYNYVSVDEKDRTFDTKLYRFPMPESELSSNSKVDQYPEWK